MTDPVHPLTPRRDRQITVVLVATLGVVVLVAIVLVVALQGNGGIAAQRRSDEITACRSEYRAPIDQADADLERAKTELGRVEGGQADTFNAGLVAAVQGDDATLAQLVERYPLERQAVRAERAKVDAAQDEKDAAAKGYSEAVRLARKNPDRFLENCRRLTR